MKLLAILAILASPAMAQECLERDPVAEQLAAQYGEALHVAALAGGGDVVELFLSADGGTWTVLVTHPDGCTRMVAAGRAHLIFERVPEGEAL